MKAKEKLSQYGLPAMTDSELLELIKWKGTISEYYESHVYKAAKELQRRFEQPEKVVIKSSKHLKERFSFLETEDVEMFWAAYANNRNAIIQSEFISKGNATGTVVCIQTIIRRALELKAKNIFLCHNHPSGVCSPSQADISITRKLKDAAKLFDMEVLDHVIIARDKYYSFADSGII